MRYEVNDAEIKAAKHPHEWFLVNLITNHVLLFVAFLSASSLQGFLILVPIISVAILGYLLIRARRAHVSAPWFVHCHWQIAARRSRFFILMLAIMGLVIGTVLLVSGGDPEPQHYALGGLGILPTMITVLALIVMESEAMHQARTGQLPKWVVEQYPNPEAKLLGEV